MENLETPGKNVLIIDPDDRSRVRTVMQMTVLDLDVVEACDAATALDCMFARSTHLVISDWPLPEDPETDLLLLKLRTSAIPVVFFSSGSAPATWEGPENIHIDKGDRTGLAQQVMRLLQSKVLATGFASKWANRAARQILVIEDSATYRGIIRRAMEKAFPEDLVREAENGREALREMSRKKVDLIITDLQMPGMDGFTFLQHIQSSPLLSRKPILVFSGLITDELRRRASAMHNVRFLAKPAPPERLVGEAMKLLEVDSPAR